MMNHRFYIALFSAALCLGAGADERGVYRWVDAEGNVFYSDRPQTETAERLEVVSRVTDDAAINEARQARLEDEQTRRDRKTEEAEVQAKEAKEAERFEENCRRARASLASIVNARRLYEPTDDGGRRYLDDGEIATRRAEAERNVAEWCN